MSSNFGIILISSAEVSWCIYTKSLVAQSITVLIVPSVEILQIRLYPSSLSGYTKTIISRSSGSSALGLF